MHWIRPICWLCLFVPATVGTQGLYALMAQPLPVVAEDAPSTKTVLHQQAAPTAPPSADSDAESIDELRAALAAPRRRWPS